MFMGAKNGTLRMADANMEYIRFGRGERILLMLPGLGDGLRSMKGTALPMAIMYRAFAKDYTVYAFSRKNPLKAGCTIRDIAGDVKAAMDSLGIARADVLGVSMGGMIAQHLAIDYPEKVGKLILVVTCAGSNPLIIESVNEWIDCAKRGDHTALMESNVRRIYSPEYYRKNKWLIPLMGMLTKPKSYDRFLIQANACLDHDSRNELGGIRAETLVIGGEQDAALGGDPSREIAAAIPGAKLKMYAQWGHGLYEEAKDFQDVVLDFLKG